MLRLRASKRLRFARWDMNRESPAANALRPLAINTYTERPRGRRRIRDKRDGLSKEPAQLTLLRSPHREPSPPTAALNKARMGPRVSC